MFLSPKSYISWPLESRNIWGDGDSFDRYCDGIKNLSLTFVTNIKNRCPQHQCYIDNVALYKTFFVKKSTISTSVFRLEMAILGLKTAAFYTNYEIWVISSKIHFWPYLISGHFRDVWSGHFVAMLSKVLWFRSIRISEMINWLKRLKC